MVWRMRMANGKYYNIYISLHQQNIDLSDSGRVFFSFFFLFLSALFLFRAHDYRYYAHGALSSDAHLFLLFSHSAIDTT